MKKRLRILFLSNKIPLPIKDGHSRRTYNVLRGLSEMHDVHFLSLDEDSKIFDPKKITHLKTFCREVELIKAPSKMLSLPMIVRLIRSLASYEPYTIWRHYSVAFCKRVTELANSGRFDIVHCDILPIAYALRKIVSTPCTLTDHDVCHVKSYRLAKQSKNPLLKAFTYLESIKLKRFESRIFSQVDLGITVSENDKNILERLCPSGKFLVVENGVDINEFRPNFESVGAKTILWVGGFGYAPNREGIYYFAETVYPLIKMNIPDVSLVLVGADVTEWLRQLSVRDLSVKVVGYVENPLPFMQAATVFVVPIFSGSGTRLKILEAMAAGKAIVSTTIGSEGIEGKDGVHYIVADEPEKFAKSVVSLLQSPDLRERLGYQGRQLAKARYSWDNIIDKIETAYQQLASRPRVNGGVFKR